MRPLRILVLICVGALALRLGALTFVQHPGVADSNHYYNLGIRILEGHGFSADYIWFYVPPPPALEHAETHWTPLTAYLAAAGMAIGGISPQAAVLPFVLIGSLLPLIGYWAARQFGVGSVGSLFAAAAVAALPEFVLNSVRTDTTLPNTLLVGLSALTLTAGLRTDRPLRARALALTVSGITAGLAYLTRNDSLLLLPAALATAILYAIFARPSAAILPLAEEDEREVVSRTPRWASLRTNACRDTQRRVRERKTQSPLSPRQSRIRVTRFPSTPPPPHLPLSLRGGRGSRGTSSAASLPLSGRRGGRG
ncbi:MAG: glycosyltransferase family 39 protein [Chloroflexi bacterium]|nr:glycosyltransferase family 39 protein [Chloroflexota bacterium]